MSRNDSGHFHPGAVGSAGVGLLLLILFLLATTVTSPAATYGHGESVATIVQASTNAPEPVDPCGASDDSLIHPCCSVGGCAASALYESPMALAGLPPNGIVQLRPRSAPSLIVLPLFHPPK